MIRRATPADAEAIAEIQRRAWLRAYSDIVDHELLTEMSLDERIVRWAERLAGDGSHTLVADLDGQIAGFVTVGPSRIEESGGEIWAIYVDPPAQGAGVGSALLTAGEAALRAAGHDRAVLGVFEANGHARHFYERRGWVHDGMPPVHDRWAPEVRYRRDLANGGGAPR